MEGEGCAVDPDRVIKVIAKVRLFTASFAIIDTCGHRYVNKEQIGTSRGNTYYNGDYAISPHNPYQKSFYMREYTLLKM